MKTYNFFSPQALKKIMIIVFWLCIWQLAAVLTNNVILLVGPLQVADAFLENLTRPDFLRIVLFSFARIGLGFLSAFFAGLLMGALSYRYAFLAEFLAPLIITLKSIPVASFAVLLLIWSGSAGLSFFISFLIVFPNVYVNTIEGLKSADRELLEMADVFGVKGWNRFCYLYRPALMPYLVSCLKISLGMSWKSGVAAEVIGMPEYSLGERLYISKIYLDTAGLFAWTLLVIFLSFLFEKMVLYLVKRFAAWKPYPTVRSTGLDKAALYRKDRRFTADKAGGGGQEIHLQAVSKAYGTQEIFRNFSLTLKKGGRYCLMAPSGSGKTTLLRLINRTTMADAGCIEGIPERIGMVFQEDRLCEEYDVIKNIMLTASRTETKPPIKDVKRKIHEEALQILPEECLEKPVRELSGGMKRRCAILRAMLSGAELIMMDEPFTGLDEENRRRTAAYIMERLEGRTLLVTTHRGEDVEFLEGVRVELAHGKGDIDRDGKQSGLTWHYSGK